MSLFFATRCINRMFSLVNTATRLETFATPCNFFTTRCHNMFMALMACHKRHHIKDQNVPMAFTMIHLMLPSAEAREWYLCCANYYWLCVMCKAKQEWTFGAQFIDVFSTVLIFDSLFLFLWLFPTLFSFSPISVLLFTDFRPDSLPYKCLCFALCFNSN